MTKRGVLYGGLIGALLILLWALRWHQDAKTDIQIKAPILAQAEAAKVIIDTRRHTITTVTRRPDGSTAAKATFLPPSGASLVVGKDSSVVISARTWGTEMAPFIGLSLGSDFRLRAALGLNFFYVRRWEVGGGLVSGNDIRDIRAFVHASYNPYGNYFVSLGMDHKQTAHLLAGLKF